LLPSKERQEDAKESYMKRSAIKTLHAMDAREERCIDIGRADESLFDAWHSYVNEEIQDPRSEQDPRYRSRRLSTTLTWP
jgi:hypothetical protein